MDLEPNSGVSARGDLTWKRILVAAPPDPRGPDCPTDDDLDDLDKIVNW